MSSGVSPKGPPHLLVALWQASRRIWSGRKRASTPGILKAWGRPGPTISSTRRNRMRVWEAEHEKSEANKAKEKAQAEFDAEQEYLKTLSYLSAEEQQRYREVQSVSFMYTKPPGLDAALVRDAEAEKKAEIQPAAAAAPRARNSCGKWSGNYCCHCWS
ncbi:hypothetical protein Vafri_9992 [Volvox africanus]|uniref:Uncharacterized protein n=1 Tax=Volvox africanus TaxID=51714 RepID=A0A8J4B5F1_9CHLO|nr:hypothetical protein Vafri_9992 [Volvox africanus]